MSDNLLVVRNLTVYNAVHKEHIKLLDNINLDLHENEILGLVGESGSGKSILISALGCNISSPLIAKADALSFIHDGKTEDLLVKGEEELRKIWGKLISFVPTNAREKLNPIMTVGRQCSDILRGNFNITREQADQRVIQMFKMVRMPDPLHNFDNYVHELSGGMAQRVVLSVAFASNPKIILADEPTVGLDVTIQRQVLDLIATLIKKAQSSVILATRDLGIVANYCDKVAVLKKGRIIEVAGVREFFRSPKNTHSQSLLEASFASFGGKSITTKTIPPEYTN